jgi:hypothetical protein
MSCETRERLSKAFLAAAVELEKATQQEVEYFWNDTLPRAVEEAYTTCEKALIDLYRHKAGHGC